MIRRSIWGRLKDGQGVDRFTLGDGAGLEVDLLTYGAAIAAIRVPDRDGAIANVVLGFADLAGYAAASGRLGAIVGRYANRIARGRFELDGETFGLQANDGANTLHGGGTGYDKRVWTLADSTEDGLRLSLISPDGDQGFPGELRVAVRYSLPEKRTLRLDYSATTDRPTVLNLSNHAYFNLSGESAGDIHGHEVKLMGERLVAIERSGIPTGELMAVAGTPFDFRQSTAIGRRIRDPHEQMLSGRGYDHCYVLGAGPAATPRPAAFVRDPRSGRTVAVSTTEPGIQFYTGNSLDGSLVGSGGLVYRQSAGLALETQHFPDSPNHPSFPSTVLRPGETFRSTTLWSFGTQD